MFLTVARVMKLSEEYFYTILRCAANVPHYFLTEKSSDDRLQH